MRRKSIIKILVSFSVIMLLTMIFVGCSTGNDVSSSTNESGEPQNTQNNEVEQNEEQAEGDVWKPERPVNVTVSAGAGGGTDLASRAAAAALEKEMGVTFQVDNMPGGAGGIAHSHVYGTKRDGYNLLGINEGAHSLAVMGAFDHTADVWAKMIVMGSQGVISVPESSPYSTLEELVEAAKNERLNLAGSQAGSVWALKALQVGEVTGVDFNMLPYEGSHPSHVAALSGEVDAVVTAVAEQKEYILAGELRPLAIIEQEGVNLEGYGEIPSISEFYPDFNDLPVIRQWLGLAIPNDTPENIKEAYFQAFEKAMQSEEIKEASETTGFDLIGLYGEEAEEWLGDLDSIFSWTLHDLGLTEKSPKEFNIPPLE